jgi:EAL domain-containing protein (putative c-di-GMP-specific phosphodiesterase class I)
VDVFDPELEHTLDAIRKENNLDRDALKLEVTESAYVENEDQLVHIVGYLQKSGYTVEMDDFGTGYSSLNMLSAIPIDVLKIDRAFVSTIDTDERTERLVELILEIAKTLGVQVIAEGAETEAQLRLLKDLGCQLVQGFYFSRPLHPSDFEDRYFKHEGR